MPAISVPAIKATTKATTKATAKAASKAAGKAGTAPATAPSSTPPAVAAPPAKKAAPKPVAVVAAKSASPAAQYPPINPVDEFIGLDKLTDAEFIAQQRDLLHQSLKTALGQARMLQAEADQLAAEMEPGDVQFDDESGEGASASMEREKDLAMAAEKVLAAEDIERAITRLKNNVYGSCTSCNRPIPRMRLRALPQATLCIGCKNGGLSRRS